MPKLTQPGYGTSRPPWRRLCAWTLAIVAGPAGAADINAPYPPTPSNVGLVPIGLYGALEGGAGVARASDPSAVYYNPAGLADAERASVSGNGSVIRTATNRFDAAQGQVHSSDSDSIPAFVGAEGRWSTRVAWGAALITPVSWSSTTFVDGIRAGTDDAVVDTIASRFSILTATGGMGVRVSDRSAVGFAVALSQVSYNSSTAFHESFPSLTYGHDVSGAHAWKVYEATMTVGGTLALTDALRGGIRITSPSCRLRSFRSFNQSTSEVDGFSDTLTSSQVTVSEADTTDYKQPLTAVLGIAVTQPGWSMEVDVRYAAPVAKYRLGNDASTAQQQTALDGSSIVTSKVAVPAATTSSKGEFDGAVGGHMHATDKLGIHLGLFTSRSGVEKGDHSFTPVTFYGVNGGVTWHPNQYSTIMIGLEYARSANTEIPALVVSNSASGGLTNIPLHMQILSASVGASYAFDE